MGQLRTYRGWVSSGDLTPFSVTVGETDLYIRARDDYRKQAASAAVQCRGEIESYIARHPAFLESLQPIAAMDGAPPIVLSMIDAAGKAGVGPMAAVAGAVAEYVGRALLELSPEVIIENGGDIFLASRSPRTIGVFAGGSPFTGKLAMEIEADDTPLGICTSSGTVGHSLSFGAADAAIVISPSTALADAAATAVANIVHSADDIPAAIDLAQSIDGVSGVVVIIGDELGVWGKVKLSEVTDNG